MRDIWIQFIIPVLMFLVMLISCRNVETNLKVHLDHWKFRQDTSHTWYPANVPGCVHTDLLANGLIPDPFFGSNEQQLQWIGESGWAYTCAFDAEEILKSDYIELVFDGLDTYSEVRLNDSLILSSDNMFRQWVIPVKNLLQPKENRLVINFFPPEAIEQKKAAQLPYPLPDQRGFTRKAPYQYGWDWGPEFVTAGIWQPVYLQGWNDLRISNVHVFTKTISNSSALIGIEAEIESSSVQEATVELNFETGLFTKEITLETGINIFQSEIEIEDPKLWWPNGMGDQPLYDLNLTIHAGKSKDSEKVSFGIRKIDLVKQGDSIGESFYFMINNVPFFAKGANYIPQDNFPARVPDEKYRQTIDQAVDANMNMLRVWGGGIYENDIFYDLCDQKGILVWQDFMFACNMYPGDSAFLVNVREEAEYQVKRLRNHPSIALWCGNNEVSEGWHNWGWQKSLGYTPADSSGLWNNYLKLFEAILPETMLAFSPNIPYHPSSPKIGWGHEEALTRGDMHYWGVWWGEEPFEIFEQKVGRFMSEYGFQGFADLRTLDSCLTPQDKYLNSPALLNHQKHPRGMELIDMYMARDFPVPASFEHYTYVSQLVQAHGVKKAIEAHRRAMPRCMGTLYWQLKDCWPVISWSSLDYYNRWKALHYFVKKAYQKVLISFEGNENEVSVFVVSDKQKEFQATLYLKIIDFEGNIYWQEKQKIEVQKAFSRIVKRVNISEVSNEDHVLVARLISGDTMMTQNLYYFMAPNELKLPPVKIASKMIPIQEGFYIELSSDRLARNVGLFINYEGHFSDNYFDLLPGEVRAVSLESKTSNRVPEIKIISLNDLRN